MDEVRVEFRPIDPPMHTVLVVDDEPALRYATARLLRSAGFRTREAATGMEGLEAADESISAAVLDVHLPDIDGLELCRLLRSRASTARLPVLHLSAAYLTDEDKVRGLDSGADAYLTHPVEPAVLIATVRALVRTRVAEDAMRRSEAKFRAIYAQAPGGICLLDEQGRLVDANPAMLELLGRDLASVAGHGIGEFVPGPWAQRVDEATRGGGLAGPGLEFPLLDPTGRATPVAWTVSAHVEPGLSMAMAIDVSERALLEEQRQQLLEREREARGAAERMNRTKDELIAVLSHELRTPLNAIMGWAHVLLRRGAGTDSMRGLEAIERNGKIQARMISDILDMSRMNTGKMPLTLEMVDPAEVVASAVEAMRPTLLENQQELVLDLAPPYRHIRADSSRLQQIIWNLVSNAAKFSPRGGEIRVSLHEDARGVRLSVADQGQGVAAEFLPHLFDRFTQGDASSNRQRGGLGLGLSIVKHLVEAHGGTVSAASEGIGRGTVFDVRLPADGLLSNTSPTNLGGEPAADDPHLTDEPEDALDGLHLLLVDDDREACAMLRIILGDRGAVVEVTHGYEGALASLEVQEPMVIISDVGMPGKDGYQLIREIRRREAGTGRRVPALALTAFTRGQDQQQALDAGFDAHCPKPVQALQLVQQVRHLAGRSAFGPLR